MLVKSKIWKFAAIEPVMQMASERRQEEASTLSPVTISLLVVSLIAIVLLLVGLVLYYRRKYRNEKDPELPTVKLVKIFLLVWSLL